MSPLAEGNFAEIQRRAFERYLLELAQGFAAEQDRLYLEQRGREDNPVIREIQLSGEYPDTCLRITTLSRVSDREITTMQSIWRDPTFFDDEGKARCSPERMVGDILMHARGG
jgi:hypothetical protein